MTVCHIKRGKYSNAEQNLVPMECLLDSVLHLNNHLNNLTRNVHGATDGKPYSKNTETNGAGGLKPAMSFVQNYKPHTGNSRI